jgi:hypothetical protein
MAESRQRFVRALYYSIWNYKKRSHLLFLFLFVSHALVVGTMTLVPEPRPGTLVRPLGGPGEEAAGLWEEKPVVDKFEKPPGSGARPFNESTVLKPMEPNLSNGRKPSRGKAFSFDANPDRKAGSRPREDSINVTPKGPTGTPHGTPTEQNHQRPEPVTANGVVPRHGKAIHPDSRGTLDREQETKGSPRAQSSQDRLVGALDRVVKAVKKQLELLKKKREADAQLAEVATKLLDSQLKRWGPARSYREVATAELSNQFQELPPAQATETDDGESRDETGIAVLGASGINIPCVDEQDDVDPVPHGARLELAPFHTVEAERDVAGTPNHDDRKYINGALVLVVMLTLIMFACIDLLGTQFGKDDNFANRVQGAEPPIRSTRTSVWGQPFQRAPTQNVETRAADSAPTSGLAQGSSIPHNPAEFAYAAIHKSGQLVLHYSSLLYSFFLGKES